MAWTMFKTNHLYIKRVSFWSLIKVLKTFFENPQISTIVLQKKYEWLVLKIGIRNPLPLVKDYVWRDAFLFKALICKQWFR